MVLCILRLNNVLFLKIMFKTSISFASGVDFCPQCGAVMPLPNANFGVNGRKLRCKVCKYELAISDISRTQSYYKTDLHQETHKEQTANVPEGPTVDRKCNRCGHDGMTYATLQTRSADEGQTVFYTCPQCRFKEIENS